MPSSFTIPSKTPTSDPSVPTTPGTPPEAPVIDPVKKRRQLNFRRSIEACKNYRRRLIPLWQRSVDYRRGKTYASQTDEDRVVVPLDWSLTEMKQSLLFSQVPAARISHPPDTLSKNIAPWIHTFEQRINDTLIQAGIETAMEETLPDCINAAGIGVLIVSYEALTEDVEVPSIDMSMFPPQIMQQIQQTGLMPNGQPIPMTTVPRVKDHRYLIERVSPANFLWPLSFGGSNFDYAPWLGRTGNITWASAQRRWNLDPRDRAKHTGIQHNPQDVISNDLDKNMAETAGEEYVQFDEIFYKVEKYDAAAKNYSAINHIIFVNGKEDPVVDEPWKGQNYDEQNDNLTGAQRYPIRVLSLAYITDEAIPPSDSAVGRSQVNEINKARTQMIKQREHSIPIRTFDVNRVDPTIQYSLMRGTWQGMIPVQGVGTNIITEVARSSFPVENFKFDSIAKGDLLQIWMVGQDDSGSNVETKGEASAIQSQTNVRIARARAKVGKFFCSTAEVLGGLLAIYEDPGSFGDGFSPDVSKALTYSILADSTLLLDANQRLHKLTEFMNLTAKSGRVDIDPVLREMATLSGLDPNVVIKNPDPVPPEVPNISLRLTGTEDMLNPLTLAFMINAGQAPTPDQIQQAKMMIQMAVEPPAGLAPPTPGNMGSTAPMLPTGGSGGPGGPAGMPPPPPMPPPVNPQDIGPLPSPPPPPIGGAEKQWHPMPPINQRHLDRETKRGQ